MVEEQGNTEMSEAATLSPQNHPKLAQELLCLSSNSETYPYNLIN